MKLLNIIKYMLIHKKIDITRKDKFPRFIPNTIWKAPNGNIYRYMKKRSERVRERTTDDLTLLGVMIVAVIAVAVK